MGIWTGRQVNVTTVDAAAPAIRVSRLDFLVKLGFIVGSIPFVSMIYGMIGGAYDYKVRTVKLKFPNLPKGFDGFRFVQISDLHTGSFLKYRASQKSNRIGDGPKTGCHFYYR